MYPLNRLGSPLGPHQLADVVIHSSIQTVPAAAVHRVRVQRDAPSMVGPGRMGLKNELSMVHRSRSVPAVGIQTLAAVPLNDACAVATTLSGADEAMASTNATRLPLFTIITSIVSGLLMGELPT